MTDFIFNTVWGWIGTGTLIVIACVAIAYFIKPWRPYAIAIAVFAISMATVFTKGYRARGVVEQRRKDAAVKKAQDEYSAIDARPDTPADVADRLRRGGF